MTAWQNKLIGELPNKATLFSFGENLGNIRYLSYEDFGKTKNNWRKVWLCGLFSVSLH